jgi:hypothetical protein
MRLVPLLLTGGCLLLVDPFPECVPEDCFGGYSCDWEEDVCRSNCADDGDCQPDYACAEGACVPECHEEDCELGCSMTAHTCRCSRNADCPEEQQCCTVERFGDDECTPAGSCFE